VFFRVSTKRFGNAILNSLFHRRSYCWL